MKTLIIGDIHGEWGPLNKLINKQSSDIILSTGDFGYWPHFHHKTDLLPRGQVFDQYGIKNVQNDHITKIHWCGGNHENWDELKKFGYTPTPIMPAVIFQPFGTTIEIDGKTILFAGGAESTDKAWRVLGESWWPDEIITRKDMDNLPDMEIDIVISHTVPRKFFHEAYPEFFIYHEEKLNDPSTFALDIVFDKYKPKQWFSGHFHHYMKGTIEGCEWVGLDMADNIGRWWIKL